MASAKQAFSVSLKTISSRILFNSVFQIKLVKQEIVNKDSQRKKKIETCKKRFNISERWTFFKTEFYRLESCLEFTSD